MMGSRTGIRKPSSRRSGRQKSSYLDILKTLLLQNQQIIIQQQNMMFMVMKQLNPGASNLMLQQQNQQQQQLHLLEESLGQQLSASQPSSQQQHQQPQNQSHPSSQQSLNQQQHHHPQQQHNNHHQHNIHHQHQQQQQQHQSHHGQSSAAANQLQDDLDAYLTPATSEQEPLETMVSNMGPDSCALSALLGGDGLMSNNLLYNPSTDFGSITPYKNNNSNGQQQHPLSNSSQHQPQQHETPSYYSSGCESLTTPRVEQQRQPTTSYISQNVVKNLNDAFKSPSKPKISVQILSGSATREMKNNKAKIIQSMNISEFLRQVHNDDSSSKSSTQ